jgi:hypothetical protein
MDNENPKTRQAKRRKKLIIRQETLMKLTLEDKALDQIAAAGGVPPAPIGTPFQPGEG